VALSLLSFVSIESFRDLTPEGTSPTGVSFFILPAEKRRYFWNGSAQLCRKPFTIY
jgi:hypothetical protein